MKIRNIKLINKIVLILLVVLLNTSHLYSEHKKILISPEGLILSPDGEKIAFGVKYKRENGKIGADIYVINDKDNRCFQITRKWLNEYPNWSADGKKIIFKRTTNNGAGIYVIDLSTLEEISLIFSGFCNNCNKRSFAEFLYPAWFENINKIMFLKYVYKNQTTQELYLYDFLSFKESFIDNLSSLLRNTVDIAIKKGYIVYTKNDEVWLLNVSEKEKRLVVKNFQVKYLRVSPDGTKILFIVRDHLKEKLYIFNLKEKERYLIYEGRSKYLGFPSWSYDGRKIIFVDNKRIFIYDVEEKQIMSKVNLKNEKIFYPLLTKSNKIFFIKGHNTVYCLSLDNDIFNKVFPE